MDGRDAQDEELLLSEYELLFSIRDLMKLYENQQISIFGRSSSGLNEISNLIESKLQDLESQIL